MSGCPCRAGAARQHAAPARHRPRALPSRPAIGGGLAGLMASGNQDVQARLLELPLPGRGGKVGEAGEASASATADPRRAPDVPRPTTPLLQRQPAPHQEQGAGQPQGSDSVQGLSGAEQPASRDGALAPVPTYLPVTTSSKPVPAAPFDHGKAAAYARQWASSPNPAYPPFADTDCTDFVSQAMLTGGWTMIGGSYFDRKQDDVWWYGKSSLVTSSYTWGGAQNFADFLAKSGRGSKQTDKKSLAPGDVIQAASANGHVHHSMVVTGQKASDLLVSYHSNNTLDRPLDEFKAASPQGETLLYWKVA